MTEGADRKSVDPPTGTVTFLFTDIEGSTVLWENHPMQMESALLRHDEILKHTIRSHGGYIFKAMGDAFSAAFASSKEATMATLAAQRSLHAEEWDERTPIRVRMALHSGAATERNGDYFGPPVNRVARLLSAGHGGQVLLSDVTYGLARDILSHLEPTTELRYLGEHRLRDLRYTERIFQLIVPDLPKVFRDLKTRGLVSSTPPAGSIPLTGEAVIVDAPPTPTRPPDETSPDTLPQGSNGDAPSSEQPTERPGSEEDTADSPATIRPPSGDQVSEDAEDRRKLINGRYRLLRTIGGGGMAEVYLARDEMLERDVALKVLRGQYADDASFVERFRREARNAASLSHPNVVATHDQGQTQDGLYYIVMEYVEGGTLQDLIQRDGQLSGKRVVEISLQVARSLRAAHEQGIVHRDIKPQNILLTRSGDAKVGDLGIARAATATRVTQEGSVVGTVQYISPEQAVGQDATPSSDLYSLGIVMHEMLTGELPFDADTLAGIVMSHVSGNLRSPRETNPDVPEELNAITTRLMAKDPGDRYPNAAALEKDLIVAGRRDPLAHDGVAPEEVPSSDSVKRLGSPPPGQPPGPTGPGGRPPDGGQRGRPTRRWRPWLAGVAGLVVVAALLGAGFWAYGYFFSESLTVPSLSGQSLEEAQATVGEDFEVVSSGTGGDSDIVVGQEPQCGAEATRGSEISVSLGPNDPTLVEVPDLTGESVKEASGMLENAGLNPGNQREEANGSTPAGQIFSQDPGACSLSERDTPVNFTVSRG